MADVVKVLHVEGKNRIITIVFGQCSSSLTRSDQGAESSAPPVPSLAVVESMGKLLERFHNAGVMVEIPPTYNPNCPAEAYVATLGKSAADVEQEVFTEVFFGVRAEDFSRAFNIATDLLRPDVVDRLKADIKGAHA